MTIVGSGTGFNRVFNGSQGMQVNRMLDKSLVDLGYPPELADKIGDLVGARIDAQRGDIQGMMRNLADYSSGLSTKTMDSLRGKGLSPFGFVPRPMDFMSGRLAGAALANVADLARGFNPFGGGISREAPFGTGKTGRSIEKQIMRDPLFKSQMEQMLGGRIIADGCKDGKLTVWRPPFSTAGAIMKQALGAGLLPKLGIAAALGGLAVPLAGAMLANKVAGSILGSLQRMEGNIASFMGGTKGNTDAARAGLQGDVEAHQIANGMGVNLANASFEDILAVLLAKYAAKKEKEILNKVQQLDKGGAANGATKGGGIGGLLGTIGGAVVGSVVPGLGTMLGASIGGSLGNLAGSAIGGAMDSARSGGGMEVDGQQYGDPSKMSDTMKQQLLQKLMSDLQKMYEMLSNMMKSMHDMQMTPIRALRG
ncbi:MAG: hypothetical protein AB2A00_11820 [Myxococcota bacterium]